MEINEQEEYWQKSVKLLSEINEKLSVIDQKLDVNPPGDLFYKSSFQALMQTASNCQGQLFLINGNLNRIQPKQPSENVPGIQP